MRVARRDRKKYHADYVTYLKDCSSVEVCVLIHYFFLVFLSTLLVKFLFSALHLPFYKRLLTHPINFVFFL